MRRGGKSLEPKRECAKSVLQGIQAILLGSLALDDKSCIDGSGHNNVSICDRIGWNGSNALQGTKWSHLESLEIHHNVLWCKDEHGPCSFAVEEGGVGGDRLTSLGTVRKSALEGICRFEPSVCLSHH